MGRSSGLFKRTPAIFALVALLAVFGSVHPPTVFADEITTSVAPDPSLAALPAQLPVEAPAVNYAAAVQIKLVTASGTQTLLTTAYDVGAFLEEQGIRLTPDDVVQPSLADLIAAGMTIHLTRVMKWSAAEFDTVAPKVVHRLDFALGPGQTKILNAGRSGLRQRTIGYTQIDGKMHKRLLFSRLLRAPRTRVIAEGVGTYAAFADFALRGLQKTNYIAANAMDMLATAYTAECTGCSGYTAIGYRAGHGIVAVDPRVIPLGTRLYIPGYGFAIAGDTGGAIVGNRIDLGFDSYGDAINFGRRVIRVYTLR